MAFVGETKILTNKGWKQIKDISGKDKVLVRNFIGDAEFIQPFALKKRQYEGEIINFGATYWSVSLTPDHKIVYDTAPDGVKDSLHSAAARDVVPDQNRYFYRRFRYIREDRGVEKLILKDELMQRTVTISDEDWYTIVAYTVTKGYISKGKSPRLSYMLDEETLLPLLRIFDGLGVSTHIGIVNGTIVLTVNRNNNLARKLKMYLGARARREMKLPNKMIYGSSQPLMRHFVGTFTSLTAKASQKRPNQLVFTTANGNLVEDLRMMCTFCGYGFSSTPSRSIFVCYILPKPVAPWTARFVEKKTYSGYTYEIDLFDGLVYVTERSLPVWMSPR
jgi:hypothetical protein